MSGFSENGFPGEYNGTQPSAVQGTSPSLFIDTPEQVELQFSVAGMGSRLIAALLDYIIHAAFLIVEFLLAALLSAAVPAFNSAINNAGKWTVAIIIILNFCVLAGYFIILEAYWHGQTPGKKVMKLRVIKDSGRQITFFESLARNLIRIVDYMPSLYFIGAITMLCNKRNKRLGDLAAGTIVVHESRDEAPMLPQHNVFLNAPATSVWQDPVAVGVFAADAIAKLSPSDLTVIDAFFARALDLDITTRADMALRIATHMTAKMGVPMPEGNPERALESIAVAMRGGR
jgi:uncharacterized RDD family membrane protein YckC